MFVPFTAPGDTVEVEYQPTKKSYCEGALSKLVEPSPTRVAPPCPVFTECGGCSWQHLPYEIQFETKKKGVLHALKRAGIDTSAVEVDELRADAPYAYRNRIQLRGDAKSRTIGFYARGENRIVPISSCPIARDEINRALPRIAEDGFREFSGKSTANFKVEIEVDSAGRVQHAFNEAHAAFGFRQVNDAQNEKLKAWVASHVVDAPLLLDLYGGHGNLSLNLKDRFAAVECVDVSVPKNLKPHPHFQFVKKDALSWAKDQHKVASPRKEASIILDPPRAGIGADFAVIEAEIAKYPLRALVLVGCDVDSFVRDCSNFLKRGYPLRKLGVLDLFPQTPHVESLALFCK